MSKANDDGDTATKHNKTPRDDAAAGEAVVVRPSSPFWALVEYGYDLKYAKLEYLLGDLGVGADDHGGQVTTLSPALEARLKELPDD
jgi:hypothetical protein